MVRKVNCKSSFLSTAEKGKMIGMSFVPMYVSPNEQSLQGNLKFPCLVSSPCSLNTPPANSCNDVAIRKNPIKSERSQSLIFNEISDLQFFARSSRSAGTTLSSVMWKFKVTRTGLLTARSWSHSVALSVIEHSSRNKVISDLLNLVQHVIAVVSSQYYKCAKVCQIK